MYGYGYVAFRPTSSRRERLPQDILRAEAVGRNGGCSNYRPQCPVGLFDLIGVLGWTLKNHRGAPPPLPPGKQFDFTPILRPRLVLKVPGRRERSSSIGFRPSWMLIQVEPELVQRRRMTNNDKLRTRTEDFRRTSILKGIEDIEDIESGLGTAWGSLEVASRISIDKPLRAET